MQSNNEKTIESWRNFLDLPLPISIEIGRTRMTVRGLLEMTESAIVKLPRSTGEGVDVRVEGKPFLRGEIIVIEDRAGVRIKEILTGEK